MSVRTFNVIKIISQAIQQLQANPPLENTKILGVEFWGLSSLSNASYYIDSRILELGLYYASMPVTNQAIQFVHIAVATQLSEVIRTNKKFGAKVLARPAIASCIRNNPS